MALLETPQALTERVGRQLDGIQGVDTSLKTALKPGEKVDLTTLNQWMSSNPQAKTTGFDKILNGSTATFKEIVVSGDRFLTEGGFANQFSRDLFGKGYGEMTPNQQYVVTVIALILSQKGFNPSNLRKSAGALTTDDKFTINLASGTFSAVINGREYSNPAEYMLVLKDRAEIEKKTYDRRQEIRKEVEKSLSVMDVLHAYEMDTSYEGRVKFLLETKGFVELVNDQGLKGTAFELRINDAGRVNYARSGEANIKQNDAYRKALLIYMAQTDPDRPDAKAEGSAEAAPVVVPVVTPAETPAAVPAVEDGEKTVEDTTAVTTTPAAPETRAETRKSAKETRKEANEKVIEDLQTEWQRTIRPELEKMIGDINADWKLKVTDGSWAVKPNDKLTDESLNTTNSYRYGKTLSVVDKDGNEIAGYLINFPKKSRDVLSYKDGRVMISEKIKRSEIAADPLNNMPRKNTSDRWEQFDPRKLVKVRSNNGKTSVEGVTVSSRWEKQPKVEVDSNTYNIYEWIKMDLETKMKNTNPSPDTGTKDVVDPKTKAEAAKDAWNKAYNEADFVTYYNLLTERIKGLSRLKSPSEDEKSEKVTLAEERDNFTKACGYVRIPTGFTKIAPTPTPTSTPTPTTNEFQEWLTKVANDNLKSAGGKGVSVFLSKGYYTLTSETIFGKERTTNIYVEGLDERQRKNKPLKKRDMHPFQRLN